MLMRWNIPCFLDLSPTTDSDGTALQGGLAGPRDTAACLRLGPMRATPPTIRERLELIRQQEFVTVQSLALLLSVSERTIWRRLADLPHVIRNGRVTRIHRASAVRYFLKRPV
jgi:hypothetical protein